MAKSCTSVGLVSYICPIIAILLVALFVCSLTVKDISSDP